MLQANICRFYMTSTCKKGVSCDFIHDDNFCKHYYNNKCKYGDKCHFYHHERERRERVGDKSIPCLLGTISGMW